MKALTRNQIMVMAKKAKRAAKSSKKNISYANLITIAQATSKDSVLVFLKEADLKEKLAVKNILAIVNGEMPKTDNKLEGTLFGMVGEKETNISDTKQTEIYSDKIEKVEITEDQKDIRKRKEDDNKNPETSDHKVKKDIVEKPGKENKEYTNFIKKRQAHLASKMGRLKVAMDEENVTELEAIDELSKDETDAKGAKKSDKQKFTCLVDSCENYDSKAKCNCSKDKVDITIDNDKAICTMYKNIDNDLDMSDEDLEKLSSRIQKGEAPKNVLSSLLSLITGKRKIARQHRKFAEMQVGEQIQINDAAGMPQNMTVDSVSTMTGTGEPALVAKTETGETTVIPTGTEVTQVATEII